MTTDGSTAKPPHHEPVHDAGPLAPTGAAPPYGAVIFDMDGVVTDTASVHAAAMMTAAGSGLIANISSFGSRGHLHSVLYGMSKSALDKMAFDMGTELDGTGVTAVSLWLGLIRTELLLSLGVDEFAGFALQRAEDPEFVGRVIAALARDPHLPEYNGHTLITAELGAGYGIVNNDGTPPDSHRSAFGGGGLFPPASADGHGATPPQKGANE